MYKHLQNRPFNWLLLWLWKKYCDKKMWKDEKTSDGWKKNNLEELKKRLNGWQLKSFEESYKYKVENGISLIKKQNLK